MALPIKALSIRQPWVWAILSAGKRIENRPRRFHYRGTICIHASLYEPAVRDLLSLHEVLDEVVSGRAQAPASKYSGHTLQWARSLRRGGIVGTADIVDCVEQSDDPWFFGPYGLVLDNAQPVEFIPVKGALGLFDWRKMLQPHQGAH